MMDEEIYPVGYGIWVAYLSIKADRFNEKLISDTV
jgi:hypothetical protein